jgi:hypothetical protein
MDEARRTSMPEADHKSQVRRAQRGIVAGYIHELSERHGERHASHSEPQPSSETGEGN